MTSRRPIGEREAIRHAVARIAWLADYWGGVVPGPGVVVEKFIQVIYTFTAVQNSQKRQKNGQFRACFGLLITENAVFCSKVLNKIYSGRKKYGASASKQRLLTELYFRPQMS
jgi:hypothetical protein